MEALKTPLTDVYGKEVEYECGPIAGHIRNTIDDLVERKKRNDELCDVRKLKLQQILQLKSCERDTDQVGLVYGSRCIYPVLFYTVQSLHRCKVTNKSFYKVYITGNHLVEGAM